MAGAITVTKLLVPLLADISDFEKQIGKADTLAAKFGKNVASVGKVALGGLTAVTTGVTAVSGALLKLAIDAAPLDTIKSAFDGLAESAGSSGDAMLEALQKSSGGMIAQRDLMLSFNKAAALVGTDFATKLPEAMQYLGKVAASTGQDMGYLMDSLVVGVGRLSPMILDNLGIQVSLEDATARAAKMFGVEESALSKTQLQAGMMNVVLEKLALNTAAMPDATQSAAAQLAQLKATFQDTKDQIGLAFLPTLSKLLVMAGKFTDRVLPPLVEFLEGALAPAVERVVGIVGDFLWMLDSGIAPIDALKIAMSMLFGPEIATSIDNIITGVQEFITNAQEVLAPVVAWLAQNIELKDVLIGLGAAIATVVLPALWGVVAAAAPIVGTFLLVVGAVAALRAAWDSNFLGIRDIAAAVWGWMTEYIPLALSAIQLAVQTALANITLWWETHKEDIQSKAQAMWNKITEIFNFFKEQFSRLFGAFRLAFEGDWYAFGEQLRVYWDEGWAAIKKIGEDTWAAIVKFFKETDWGQVGKDILTGIANGIKGGASFLANAINDVVNAALAAVRGFFGGPASNPEGPYGGIPGQNAAGTTDWGGGLTWVGELGPELVNIPAHSEILNSSDSLALAAANVPARAAGGVAQGASNGMGSEIHHHYPVTVYTRATTGTYLQDLTYAQSQA